MKTLQTILQHSTRQLQTAGIPSARLDAELLLSHVLNQPRTFLHAHPDHQLSPLQTVRHNLLLRRRSSRQPLAYITRQKEFYNRPFFVNQKVLIPRPESETLIDLAKSLAPPKAKVLDLGAGSGCLGITLKLERPDTDLTLSDLSRPALKVAAKNAKNLAAAVQIRRSNLLQNLPKTFDLIIANLPYLSPDWEISPEAHREPAPALFAENKGEKLYHLLFQQLPSHLAPTGKLII
jgi:release factor glutamine methyltransferase